MAWIVPKTNWVYSDKFNASDYNRIINNISVIKTLADSMFKVEEYESLGSEKNETSMIYAREMNAIETDIQSINESTYKVNVGDRKTYYVNEHTPTFSDFNRIESACLKLYDMLTAHRESLPKLAITLSGGMIRP